MFGLLAPLAIKGGKFLASRALHFGGAHHGVLGSTLQNFSGVPSVGENVFFDLLGRLGPGIGVSFYFTNETFRHGANECLRAIAEAVKGVVF